MPINPMYTGLKTVTRASLGAAITLAIALSASASNQNPVRRHAAVHPPAPPIVTPTPPPSPLTLQQEPAMPPQVTYREGALTINAPNSTLVDILRAVRQQTGAEMDVPGNPSDRVVGHFGPGPARDVLAALLNGSRYNYVLLGSASDPNALEHLILTAQTGGGELPPPPPVQQAQQAAPQPGVFGGDAEPAGDFGTLSSGNTDAEQPPDVDQQQASDDQTVQPDDNGFQPNVQPGGIRTPQQLLQELQQRQQQGQNGQLFQPGAPIPGPQTPQQ